MVLGFGTAILALCDRRFNMVSGVLFGDFSTLKRGTLGGLLALFWGLGSRCGSLQAPLGSFWLFLVVFERPLGPLWAALGSTLGAFGLSLGGFWGHSGELWDSF